MDVDIGLDEDDEITDIREQIFHNTVREQIVSLLTENIFSEIKKIRSFTNNFPNKHVEKKKRETFVGHKLEIFSVFFFFVRFIIRNR